MNRTGLRLLCAALCLGILMTSCSPGQRESSSDGSSREEPSSSATPAEPHPADFTEEEKRSMRIFAQHLTDSGLGLASWDKILPPDYPAAVGMALLHLADSAEQYWDETKNRYHIPQDTLESSLAAIVDVEPAALRDDSALYSSELGAYAVAAPDTWRGLTVSGFDAEPLNAEGALWRYDVTDPNGTVVYRVEARVTPVDGQYRYQSCQVKNLDYFDFCVQVEGGMPLAGHFFSEPEELSTYELFMIAIGSIQWERDRYEEWEGPWKRFTVIPVDAIQSALERRLGSGIALDPATIASYDPAAGTITLNVSEDSELPAIRAVLKEDRRTAGQATLVIEYTDANAPENAVTRIYDFALQADGEFTLLGMNTVI